MYNHNYTYYYHTMTLTVYIIGIYVIIDPNSIHKKRPSTKCTRSFCIISYITTILMVVYARRIYDSVILDEQHLQYQ